MAVTILSATYADRKYILTKTLPLWEKLESVVRIILIDNDSSYSVADFVKQEWYQKVEVFTFSENMGSAWAYKKAMEIANAHDDTEYCIILDDDNLISQETLLKLIVHHQSLEVRYPDKPIVCLSVRMNMAVMLEDLSHQKTPPEPTKNSSAFCGVDVFSLFSRLWWSKDDHTYHHEAISLLWGTYWGSFFHKKLIDQVGTPREELFLYADDPEWGIRIYDQWGKIILFTDCSIDDIDDSWWVNRDEKGNLIRKRANPLVQGSDFRIFYGIRGLVWLEHNFFIKNPIRYFLNQCTVIGWMGVLAIFMGKWRRYKIILQAIRHGKKWIFDNTLYRNE